MPTLPEIRIKDGWLVRENVSQYLHELWGGDTPLADDEWMAKCVEEYQEAWKPWEEKILTCMTETLGLEFRQNVIDVFIAPWFNAISDPLIIGVSREPDEFIDLLTHELIHRLLTDNTSLPHDHDLAKDWQLLFGAQHSFTTLVHIPVHALHKVVYLDVLKDPARLERDIARNVEADAEDYVKAWDFVEAKGCDRIIEKLKKAYNDYQADDQSPRKIQVS